MTKNTAAPAVNTEIDPRIWGTPEEWAAEKDRELAAAWPVASFPKAESAAGCAVCGGTGWMTYPHPDDQGGIGTVAGACEACVQDSLCPACGKGMMDWGAILICVYCGFTWDGETVTEVAADGR